jgi:hypothetical protein
MTHSGRSTSCPSSSIRTDAGQDLWHRHYYSPIPRDERQSPDSHHDSLQSLMIRHGHHSLSAASAAAASPISSSSVLVSSLSLSLSLSSFRSMNARYDPHPSIIAPPFNDDDEEEDSAVQDKESNQDQRLWLITLLQEALLIVESMND